MTISDWVCRVAVLDDLAWLIANDGHLGEPALRVKVAAGEIFVAEIDGKRAGLLRLDFLWSKIPFIAHVRVDENMRHRGLGTALVQFTCDRMRTQGAAILLSSTSADELVPQAWHRANGFEECGVITQLNDNGADEIFFRKQIRS